MAFNLENVETRRYLYTVTAAAIPVLLAFNIIAPAEVDIYLNLAAAVLGVGVPVLARANTPKPGETAVITNEPK